MKTRLCELFRIEYPIVSAGMGAVALAELAAAVSEAGGLGTIGLAALSPEMVHDEIGAARQLTSKPLAVNVLIPFLRPGLLEAVAAAPIDAVTLFWGDPSEQIPPFKATGKLVIWQCGSPAEANAAMRAGADAIIAQGFESGGHVRGETTTFALIPQVRDAIGDLPMIAAGGIADGRGLAAALALGADGVAIGTRFLASREASVNPRYKEMIVSAHSDDTVHTKLFDVGWPDAAHRVIRSAVYDEWEEAGRPESGNRPGEGATIGTYRRAGIEAPLLKYSVMPPADYIEGDIKNFALYAGQSCGLVTEVLTAAEMVRAIIAEARAVISSRLSPLL